MPLFSACTFLVAVSAGEELLTPEIGAMNDGRSSVFAVLAAQTSAADAAMRQAWHFKDDVMWMAGPLVIVGTLARRQLTIHAGVNAALRGSQMVSGPVVTGSLRKTIKRKEYAMR